jgi:predicted small lipoprotein YifL
MKTRTTFALVLGVLAVATLAGCRTGPAQQPDAPTENVSATVDAAIEATRTAEQRKRRRRPPRPLRSRPRLPPPQRNT